MFISSLPIIHSFLFLPILSAGVALTYFTIKVSFYWTLFTYGFMFGIGVGIAYATPMGCAMKVIDCLTAIVMIYIDIFKYKPQYITTIVLYQYIYIDFVLYNP